VSSNQEIQFDLSPLWRGVARSDGVCCLHPTSPCPPRLNSEGFPPSARIKGMHLITFFRPSHLILVACLALPLSPIPAQEKPAGPPPRPQPVLATPETISIDFPGGPFSKLVAMLAAKEGMTLSIIQSEGLDPTLPAFAVREVYTNAVIVALRSLLEPQGFSLLSTGPNLAVLSRQPEPAFVSLQLEKKIGPRPVEELIDAIQQGCELASGNRKSPSLRFKYHPGTKLLFVAGQPAEVNIAHQVFASLPDNPEKFPTPPPEKK